MPTIFLALLVLLLAAPAAFGQVSARETAEQALAEGRFAEALAAAERAVAADRSDAEAQYLLGRVLFAPGNPARDELRAGRAVARALELEPGNAVYLVARIESLRRDSPTFFGDLLLMQQRYDLARRLLGIDSTNAFAHEELGIQAIRDFYQYRNALALPGLTFGQRTRGPVPHATTDQTLIVRTGREEDIELEDTTPVGQGLSAPGALAVTDRLDVDQLEQQGGGTLAYRARAEAAYRDAIGHLRTALRQDPRRRSVYDHLVRLGVLSGDYAAVVPFIDEMLVQFDRDPSTWLFVGLVQHRLGDYDAAEVAFQQAIRRMSTADSAAFADLRMILPPDQVPAFEADPAGFTQRYWTARDPRFLNVANERRTEHFARLVTADLLFRSEQLGLPGWRTPRGELFVRYGPPQRDVILDGGYAQVLEQFADRNPAFVSGDEAQANRFNVWDYGDFRFVFEDPNRNGEFRLYAPPADVYGLSGAGDVSRLDYVTQARERIRAEPERFTFQAPGRAIGLPYRVTAFRGDAGRTDLYLAYGVPLAVSESTEPVADVDVSIRTGAFLIGADQTVRFERRRTVYGLRASQISTFDGTRLWTSVEALTAQPGPHEISLEFETLGGTTSAVQRRALDVPDFGGDGLRLSDMLLAYAVDPADGRAAPGRIVRNDLSIAPAPWGVFGVDEPVFVYVELYGLGLRDGRTEYDVEARLIPRDDRRGLARVFGRMLGGRERGVGASSESQGASTDDWQSLTLDARGQAPGTYTLQLVVRDRVSGRSAQQEVLLMLE